MPVLSKLKKGLFMDEKAKEDLSIAAVKQYSIKTPSIDKRVMELSGGNQQKVILGRWTSEKIVTELP
jgi:ABC-type sugar transport system ATPase subunit